MGAQIFDRGYLRHFSTDRHKILHGWGFCGVASTKPFNPPTTQRRDNIPLGFLVQYPTWYGFPQDTTIHAGLRVQVA